MSRLVTLITCEHASNAVPPEYAELFADLHILQTHEGWDPGALEIAQIFGDQLDLPVYTYDFTRLLIEVNRSLGHERLFSVVTQKLTADQKEHLVVKYYLPYRQKVEELIAAEIANGNMVIHLSVHTFTPIYFGVKRAVEVGLLFDESKKMESRFCGHWQKALKRVLPELVIMANEPYKGSDDGFTTYLRTRFSENSYLGLELEVSQKYHWEPAKCLITSIIATFEEARKILELNVIRSLSNKEEK
ncbi:MAG: N-formylglutamate amidohydrolase [Cyclobacteriaceae bacterium]